MIVVLVPGAWADGSSWAKVISALRQKAIKAVMVALPLTTLADDVAALERTLDRMEGPVVLVGHAYAGAVIALTRNPKVKALVYVAALAPAAGETVADVFYRNEPHPQAPHFAPDQHGLIWLPENAFAEAFAQNASAEEQALLAAVQRPGRTPAVAGRTELVSGGRSGSHDRPLYPALHGPAHACARQRPSRRSHPERHRSSLRRGPD
jgi:pimeloyl-ACP methyl ester carboxylesterase